MREGAKVIIINPEQDGVYQITVALASCQATSLHIVCQGEPGCLHLGKTPLHEGNLQQYRQLLQQWRVRDILRVACNVAVEPHPQPLPVHGEGSKSVSFLQQLREVAGANIAASAQRVGNLARGGSWELEYRLGCVSSPLAFLPQVRYSYPGIFPPSFSTASNFTVGSASQSVAVGDFNGDGKLDLAKRELALQRCHRAIGKWHQDFPLLTPLQRGCLLPLASPPAISTGMAS